jgi:hypothetical protein
LPDIDPSIESCRRLKTLVKPGTAFTSSILLLTCPAIA